VSARRFFVDAACSTGGDVALRESDARKILRVLRLRDGDRIELVDAAGSVFEAAIVVNGAQVRARPIAAREPPSPPSLHVDLAQAVPKGAKMDFIVEKATELGAAAILPFLCERTVPTDVGPAKLERWRRLARAASQQSGRSDVPGVEDPLPFQALLERFAGYDLVLLAWERAEAIAARERLPQLLAGVRKVLVVVGPEGGLSASEAETACERGARELWLGPRILRAETAPIVVLAMLAYAAS